MINFDDILKELGEFGRYQKWVCFLVFLPGISHGIRMMISTFLLNVPNHRCAIPGYDNDTFAIQSEYHAILINKTIPYLEVAGDVEYARCLLYKEDNYTFTNEHIPENGTIVGCQKWVYDKSVFINTAATELNLVCNDAMKPAHAQMIFMGGYLVGSFAVGAIGDKIGRKKALCISVLLHLSGGFALAWAPGFICFVILRFINAFGTAGAFTTCFVIGVEIVGPSKRVWTGIILEIFFAIGMVILAGSAYFIREWHTLEIAMSAHVVFFLIYWWIIPESPRWLLSEFRMEEVKVFVNRAATVNKVTLPEKLFDNKDSVEPEEKAKTASIFQLFTSHVMCIRTIIIFINWLVVSMVYYGLSLNDNLGAGSLHLNFLLVGLVEFPAYFLCILLLDRVGRKFLHCASMVLGGVSCILTIFTILYAGSENQWVTILLAMIGKLGAAAGFAVIYIFSSEIFPTVVRNAAVGASSSMARVGGMISPYVVDWGKIVGGDFGRALPLMLFGGLSVGAGLLALFLPETLNHGLPETMQDGKQFGRGPTLKKKHRNEKTDRGSFQLLEGPSQTTEHTEADLQTEIAHKA